MVEVPEQLDFFGYTDQEPCLPKSLQPMTDVTQILRQGESGSDGASTKLLRVVYGELLKLAAAKLAHEKPGQTLQKDLS